MRFLAKSPPGPLKALEKRLGYRFKDAALLETALTHPSWLHDHPSQSESNQRLEYLGDAVLQLVLSESLFGLYPQDREGGLTKRRAALTRGAFLAKLGHESGLDACLRMSAGEEASGGRTKQAALEDAFEALVGALFVEGGYSVARRVVARLYGDLGARLAGGEEHENPKGRLQELVQPVHGNDALRYEQVGVAGAHHARRYEIAVLLSGRALGRGSGTSKKLAEEEAARAALEALSRET